MRVAEGIRIAQCVACAYDPRTCKATDEDEDNKSLCRKYKSIFKEGDYDKGRSKRGEMGSREEDR